MQRLSTERYLQARAFLNDQARPLERLLFEHDFEGAPAWPVFSVLAEFQNADGGFGHALEPDSHTSASGALATSVGLKVLADLGAPASHPMVRAAVDYLEATLHPASRVWRIVPEAAAAAPHAPWWAQEGLEERFGGYRLNPRADILAQLHALGSAARRSWLDELTADVVAEVERSGSTMEMHDLIGAVRLLDAPGLRPEQFESLRKILTPLAHARLAEATAVGYGLRPLAVAPRPDSALAKELSDQVAAQLDEMVTQQGEDGAWWPVWSWGEGVYPEAWEVSRLAWAGVLTLDALRNLHAFKRIDRG